VIASRFVDAQEAAINYLCQHPCSGSLRFAYELDMTDLRSWSLHGFPYIIFYTADDERIDILRVLHASRDIPAHLAVEDH